MFGLMPGAAVAPGDTSRSASGGASRTTLAQWAGVSDFRWPESLDVEALAHGALMRIPGLRRLTGRLSSKGVGTDLVSVT